MRHTLSVAAATLLLVACTAPPLPPQPEAAPPPSTTSSTPPAARPAAVQSLAAAVVGRLDRADGAADGLEIVSNVLLESTNVAGAGGIRELDQANGGVRRTLTDQPARVMSGLTFTARPGRPPVVWQLTRQAGIAIARDATTLAQARQTTFKGEGHGLCDDGTHLVQSDGTTQLVLRNPDTFAPQQSITVTGGWWKTGHLGELECVQASGRRAVWAVLTGTSWMVRVDIETSTVTAVADLAAVMTAAANARTDQTINAIAAIPHADNEFWVSGSGWSSVWKIKLTPRP